MRFFYRSHYLLILPVLLLCLIRSADGEVRKGGDHYYRIGDWKRAVQEYAEIVKDEPSPLSLRRLAESYYHLGKLEDAEKTLKSIIEGNDETSQRVLLLLISARRGETARATGELQLLLKEHEGNGRIYTALGMVAMAGDHKSALSYFEKALRKDYNDFWAWFYTGAIYEQTHAYDKAIKAYQKALRVNPDFAQAVNNLGYCFKERHFYSSAITQYKRAIELVPDNPDYRYNIGNAYTLRGMVDNALSSYQQAILLEPTFAKAHYNLARTYVRKGMVEAAIKEFKLYLEYADEYLFRTVATESSVEEEIENLELYLEYQKPY